MNLIIVQMTLTQIKPIVIIDGVGDVCRPQGGGNEWDTRPTFGVSHETRETMMVDTGFRFNDNSFSLTDNHHTPFDQQSIELGTVNSFGNCLG